jgi:hypothetical protein
MATGVGTDHALFLKTTDREQQLRLSEPRDPSITWELGIGAKGGLELGYGSDQ